MRRELASKRRGEKRLAEEDWGIGGFVARSAAASLSFNSLARRLRGVRSRPFFYGVAGRGRRRVVPVSHVCCHVRSKTKPTLTTVQYANLLPVQFGTTSTCVLAIGVAAYHTIKVLVRRSR
jgi:hypothetical protein